MKRSQKPRGVDSVAEAPPGFARFVRSPDHSTLATERNPWGPTVSAVQPASSTPARKRKGLLAAIWTVGILLLASLVGVGFLLVSAGSAAATEIVLESAADVGPNPFSADPFAGTPPTTPAAPSTPSTPNPSATPATAPTVSGATPGLYGGTQDIGSCDPQQMITFLDANPDKAAAWVAAQNSDPQLGWPGGTLAVADLGAYINSLTSVVLMADTRVTNHGFSGGIATPRQSILEAGTAVLVDSFGVPRARCYCGNPLIPAVPVPASTPITGTPWPGFDPNQVVTITATPTAIATLLLGTFQNPGAPLTPVNMPAPGAAAPSPAQSPTPTPTPTAPTPSTSPTAAPAVAPPAGAFCADPYAGGPTLTYTVVNTLDRYLDVFFYDDNCDPNLVMTLAPFETGATVYGDLPNITFVVTSGTSDIISSVTLVTDGGTWTIQ